MRQQAGVGVVNTQVLKNQALAMRMSGATYTKIAKSLKISLSTAHEYVTGGLEDVRENSAELATAVRDLDLARMDAMLIKLWSRRGEVRVADTILRILERRSKLVGADAPVKWEGSGPGGGPIPIQAGVAYWDLEKLTVEQLRQLDQLMEVAAPIALEPSNESAKEESPL